MGSPPPFYNNGGGPPLFYNNGGSPPPFYNNGGGPPHGDECEGVCHGCYELCGEDCPCAKDDKEGCKKWADENGCNDCFECHKKREQGTEAKGEGEGEGKDEGEGEGEGKGKEEKATKEPPAAPAMIQQDPGKPATGG